MNSCILVCVKLNCDVSLSLCVTCGSSSIRTHLATIATLAPSSLNLVDIPFPSPVPPPVTKTTLSLNESGGSIVFFLAAKWAACGPWVTSDLDIVVEKDDDDDADVGSGATAISGDTRF